LILVPLFYLKFLDRIRRLRVAGTSNKRPYSVFERSVERFAVHEKRVKI